jgi:hypothetical protein
MIINIEGEGDKVVEPYPANFELVNGAPILVTRFGLSILLVI